MYLPNRRPAVEVETGLVLRVQATQHFRVPKYDINDNYMWTHIILISTSVSEFLPGLKVIDSLIHSLTHSLKD